MKTYTITDYNESYFLKVGAQIERAQFGENATQLDSKQAWIHRIGKYIVLQSYNTLVGVLDSENMTFFEFGKYSRTTSAQVSSFCALYGCKRELIKEV